MVRAGEKMRKAYLIAFLDDHSRLIPHAEFYLSENVESYTDALEKALSKRGLPRKIYTDNGSPCAAITSIMSVHRWVWR